MYIGGLYVIITIIFYIYSILIVLYNSLSINYTAKNILVCFIIFLYFDNICCFKALFALFNFELYLVPV
jgi:hypothetical protein